MSCFQGFHVFMSNLHISGFSCQVSTFMLMFQDFYVSVRSPSLSYSLVSPLPFCFVLFHWPRINGLFFVKFVLLFCVPALWSSSLHTVSFGQTVKSPNYKCISSFFLILCFIVHFLNYSLHSYFPPFTLPPSLRSLASSRSATDKRRNKLGSPCRL